MQTILFIQNKIHKNHNKYTLQYFAHLHFEFESIAPERFDGTFELLLSFERKRCIKCHESPEGLGGHICIRENVKHSTRPRFNPDKFQDLRRIAVKGSRYAYVNTYVI